MTFYSTSLLSCYVTRISANENALLTPSVATRSPNPDPSTALHSSLDHRHLRRMVLVLAHNTYVHVFCLSVQTAGSSIEGSNALATDTLLARLRMVNARYGVGVDQIRDRITPIHTALSVLGTSGNQRFRQDQSALGHYCSLASFDWRFGYSYWHSVESVVSSGLAAHIE